MAGRDALLVAAPIRGSKRVGGTWLRSQTPVSDPEPWGVYPRLNGEPDFRVFRLTAFAVLFGALCGCSGGGLVPYGPHSLSSATLKQLVADECQTRGLSPKLVNAMIYVESHGAPSAVSSAGAAGLMQLMPDTATLYGVMNRFDPVENVSGGCSYMRDLLKRYHKNVTLALAAYNAGPGVVDAARGVPPFPETRAYVARVSAALHSTN